MPEREKDEAGTTVDEAGGAQKEGEPQLDDETESSPGTIARGGGDSEMTQASGGSVD